MSKTKFDESQGADAGLNEPNTRQKCKAYTVRSKGEGEKSLFIVSLLAVLFI